MAPALHALVVGVSAYPHLPGEDGRPGPKDYGMRQLSARVELARYSLATDFAAPVTTYTGTAPDEPATPPREEPAVRSQPA